METETDTGLGTGAGEWQEFAVQTWSRVPAGEKRGLARGSSVRVQRAGSSEPLGTRISGWNKARSRWNLRSLSFLICRMGVGL